MDFDELLVPQPKPRPLDTLSIAELEDYVQRLQAEIERARSAIAAKKAHLSGAESLFKKS